jgi:hypothetical protein
MVKATCYSIAKLEMRVTIFSENVTFPSFAWTSLTQENCTFNNKGDSNMFNVS